MSQIYTAFAFPLPFRNHNFRMLLKLCVFAISNAFPFLFSFLSILEEEGIGHDFSRQKRIPYSCRFIHDETKQQRHAICISFLDVGRRWVLVATLLSRIFLNNLFWLIKNPKIIARKYCKPSPTAMASKKVEDMILWRRQKKLMFKLWILKHLFVWESQATANCKTCFTKCFLQRTRGLISTLEQCWNNFPVSTYVLRKTLKHNAPAWGRAAHIYFAAVSYNFSWDVPARRGVGSRSFLSKTNPARAGWPRRLALVRVISRFHHNRYVLAENPIASLVCISCGNSFFLPTGGFGWCATVVGFSSCVCTSWFSLRHDFPLVLTQSALRGVSRLFITPWANQMTYRAAYTPRSGRTQNFDEIWRYCCLWILALGIKPDAPDPALIYQPVG